MAAMGQSVFENNLKNRTKKDKLYSYITCENISEYFHTFNTNTLTKISKLIDYYSPEKICNKRISIANQLLGK